MGSDASVSVGWLLRAMGSPTASAGRGLVRGRFFDRAGPIVAITAGEGLVRESG